MQRAQVQSRSPYSNITNETTNALKRSIEENDFIRSKCNILENELNQTSTNLEIANLKNAQKSSLEQQIS